MCHHDYQLNKLRGHVEYDGGASVLEVTEIPRAPSRERLESLDRYCLWELQDDASITADRIDPEFGFANEPVTHRPWCNPNQQWLVLERRASRIIAGMW